MARLPRLILPGVPYHVTQRGNRRAPTFFEDGNYTLYRDLLAQAAERGSGDTALNCRRAAAPYKRRQLAMIKSPSPSHQSVVKAGRQRNLLVKAKPRGARPLGAGQ
jgi:hypothetical protein